MNSRGLTLVETLVSLALGSVLCLAIALLLTRVRQAYMQDEQLVRTQENGHYALRLLSRELAMAGYFGEALPGEIAPVPAGGSDCYRYLVQMGPALEHYDNLSVAGTSELGIDVPSGCSRPGDHQPGADALLVRRTVDLPAVHRGNRLHPTASGTLYLRLGGGDTELSRGGDGLSVDGSLWRFHPQLFFLRRYSRFRGDGIPALCRIRLSLEAARTAPVECLVEGVEQMQVEFGVDSDDDGRVDRYLARPTLQQMRRAVVARIQLLLRSPLPLPGHLDGNRYSLGNAGESVPGDGFFRRVVTTAVLLRNSDVRRS